MCAHVCMRECERRDNVYTDATVAIRVRVTCMYNDYGDHVEPVHYLYIHTPM